MASCLASLVRPFATRPHQIAVLRLRPLSAAQQGYIPRLNPRSSTSASAIFTPLQACAASSSVADMTSPEIAPRAKAVLDYWLGEGWESAPPGDTRADRRNMWFQGGKEVDDEILERFEPDIFALMMGKYDSWREKPVEALAGIILGDQFMRNAYRGKKQMYYGDEKALPWAKELLKKGAEQLTPIQRVWVIMPLMHSELLADQKECVAQFAKLVAECEEAGLKEMAYMAKESEKFAKAHQEVIQQWGRFPHRNAIIGRRSSPEEEIAMAQGAIPKW